MTRREAIAKYGEEIVTRAEELFGGEILPRTKSNLLFWQDLTDDSRLYYFRLARGVQLRFLVINEDRHTDDEYTVCRDLPEALEKARELVDRAKIHYGEHSYVTECKGTDGWHFSEYGEDSWHVVIREIEVPI